MEWRQIVDDDATAAAPAMYPKRKWKTLVESVNVGDEEALWNFSQTLEPVTLKSFEDIGRLSLWVWRKKVEQ